jgi:hypothetical protein
MSSTRARAVAVGLAIALTALGADSQAQSAKGRRPAPAGDAGGEARTGPSPGGMTGPGRGENSLVILMTPAVQKELKLSEDQKTRIFERARQSAEQARDMLQATLQGGGADSQAMMAATARLRQENERILAQLLDGTQAARFEQIRLQVEGPLAVARPEIASKLRLTPAQAQQVQAIMINLWRQQRALSMSLRGPGAQVNNAQFEAGRQGAATLRKAAAQQIGRVLNRKQKDAFNKLLGEPFDLSKIDPDLVVGAAADRESTSPARGEAGASKGRPRPKGERAKSSGRKPDPEPPPQDDKPDR